MGGLEYSSSNEWNLFRAPWCGQEGAPRSPSYQWPLPLSWGFINMHWRVWGYVFDIKGALGHELCRPLESQLGPGSPASPGPDCACGGTGQRPAVNPSSCTWRPLKVTQDSVFKSEALLL